MNKLYGCLDIKAYDDKSRKIVGVTSTVSPDRVDDIVEPKGAQFKLPLPLLSQHDHALPIGLITKATVSDNDIEIEADIAEDSGLEYIETAWKQIKAGLVRGLSIGYRALEYTFIKDSNGIHIKTWLWLESSAVTVPANAEATITSIKSYDIDPVKRALAASAMSGANAAVERALAMRKKLGID